MQMQHCFIQGMSASLDFDVVWRFYTNSKEQWYLTSHLFGCVCICVQVHVCMYAHPCGCHLRCHSSRTKHIAFRDRVSHWLGICQVDQAA